MSPDPWNIVECWRNGLRREKRGEEEAGIDLAGERGKEKDEKAEALKGPEGGKALVLMEVSRKFWKTGILIDIFIANEMDGLNLMT